MKASHKLILFLLAVYFALMHITTRIELRSLRDRSDRLEMLLLMEERPHSLSGTAPSPEFKPARPQAPGGRGSDLPMHRV